LFHQVDSHEVMCEHHRLFSFTMPWCSKHNSKSANAYILSLV